MKKAIIIKDKIFVDLVYPTYILNKIESLVDFISEPLFADEVHANKAVFHGAGSIKPKVSDDFWAQDIKITNARVANAVSVAENTISDEEINFLQEDYLTRIRERIRLTESNVEYIGNDTFHFICEDSYLRFLCWLWHCILFCKRAKAVNEVPSWPLPMQPAKMTGDIAGMFPAIVILSGYDNALMDYKKLGGLPEYVIEDTLTSVEECMNIFRYHGLTMSHLNRLLTHSGALFLESGGWNMTRPPL